MSDFIKDVLLATEQAESPRSYFYWAALASVSAVVRNNVYLSKGGLYKLKPNIYVILKGPSGIKKGLPVYVAKKLVQLVGNTRVISGINSIEKILTTLGTAKTLENGTMVTEGTCLLVNDELSTMILDNPMSQTYLTALYDSHYHDDFTYDTKSGGEIRIKKPYITILGASNDEHFQDFLHKKSLKGGFIARCLINDERVRYRINPLTEDQDELPYESLASTLKEIGKIVGKFSWSDNGKTLFEEWYNDLAETMRNNPEGDITGTMNRIHDQMLKIAMLLSLSKGHDLFLQLDDIEDGIRTVTEFMTLTKSMTLGTGDSDLAKKQGIFLNDLLNAVDYTITHVKFMNRRFNDMSVEDVNRIVDIFSQAELVEIVRGAKLSYRLTEKAIREFSGLKAGGN